MSAYLIGGNAEYRGEVITILQVREFLGIDKGIKVFVHNRLSEAEIKTLASAMGFGYFVNQEKDFREAKVLSSTNNSAVYRIGNEIYFIPATIKAVVNEGDGKIKMWFDYPCEMKREDLIEY